MGTSEISRSPPGRAGEDAEATTVRLTGLVVAQDEAARIGKCLASLSFCDELLVVDGGSADDTVAVAERFGARVCARPFDTINAQKEYGRRQARGAWVLNLDADEACSPELAAEVRRVVDGDGDRDAFRAPFRNHFRGIWLRRGGYYPDRHVRLFRRDRARYGPDDGAHDRLTVEGAVGDLCGAIHHDAFRSLAHFAAKSDRYAFAFARAAHARGRRAGALTIVAHTAARFVKSYVLQRGFLAGTTGLVLAGLQAAEVFYKYARLWELGRFDSDDDAADRGA